MPLTIGIIAGAFVASYMLAVLIAEENIGRPSSTAALGYLVVPIYSVIVALIGVGVGFLVRTGIKLHRDDDHVSIISFLLKSAIVLIISSGIAIALGIKEIVDYEALNAPQLLSNGGELNRAVLSRKKVPSIEAHAKLIWEFQNESIGSVIWNGTEVTADVDQSVRLNLHLNSERTLHYDVRRYSYLTEITAVELQAGSGEGAYLAVLARLRATSFRSILLIYNANGKLVYEELLKRCGRKQYMGIVDGLDGENLVVDICSPITIKTNNASQDTQPG